MPSDKFHSLVGMQDTDKAIKHARLMADERKRLSSLTNWKPRGYSVLQVRTANFFISSALSLCPFTNTFPYPMPVSLVRCRKDGRRSSQWYVIRFLNHRILSSCRLMFDRSSGKGKTQIGMAKFQAPRGFGEISTPAEGGEYFAEKTLRIQFCYL